jgi:hypothetical protein
MVLIPAFATGPFRMNIGTSSLRSQRQSVGSQTNVRDWGLHEDIVKKRTLAIATIAGV